MSPQMNGEPRVDAGGTADPATEPTRAAYELDRPPPQELNTDRLSKTVIKGDAPLGRGDAQLAPLFTDDATLDFRKRWDSVQKSFVDDPREAVHAADELVAQVTKTLAETFAQQRSTLEQSFDQADAPTTENLRLALRQYRAFFERLLAL
jgi:hypothetical protein